MNNKRTEIIFTSNSPYYIVNGEGETYKSDIPIKLKSVTPICRCGQSKSMPYCDANHEKVGLKTGKSEDRSESKWKDYTGENIIVHFNLGLCCHAKVCITELPSVFDVNERPWINADGASVDEIIEIVRKCPSGALTYTKDGEHVTDFDSVTNINIQNNGPIVVTGNVELIDDNNSIGELVLSLIHI